MNFRIPNFPLGALLIVILSSVALFFAFPDLPAAWLWQAMIACSVILWAIGAGVLGESSSLNGRPNDRGEANTSQENVDQASIPREFIALIDAINTQGRANRAEERREDNGKRSREIVTIVLLWITAAAIISQVIEMRKVYDPIRDQAEAAKNQAKAALDQAGAAKIQADAARDAARSAQENAIAAARAWVGPITAAVESPPVAGTSLRVNIGYQNTGRQPATDFSPYAAALFTLTPDEEKAGAAVPYMESNVNECRARRPITSGQVVYPTIGQSGNTFFIQEDGASIDDAIVNGGKLIVFRGCFVYVTVGTPHHSAFCFFYRSQSNKLAPLTLNYCNGGSYAD